MYCISPIHSFVSVIFATWGMFYVCGDDVNVFNNFDCFNQPRMIHMWTLMHSSGYFLVDLVVLIFFHRGTTTMDIQMYIHHVLSIFNFYGTIFLMNFTLVFGTMLIFVEISTIFISIRWLLFKHDMGASKWMAINTILIFFTFCFGRWIFQLVTSFGWGLKGVMEELDSKILKQWKVVLMIEMAISVGLSIIINTFWMMLVFQ